MKMKKSHFILIVSGLLSLLCFIPANPYWSNDSTKTWIVFGSFICVVSSSFPLFADHLLDLTTKTGFPNFGLTNDLHLVERWCLLFCYVYPSIGYFILLAAFPDKVGLYYSYLTNSQTSFLGDVILTIIHTSSSQIWNFSWTLSIVVCLQVSCALSPFSNLNIAITLFYILTSLTTLSLFLRLYRKTILATRKKGWNKLTPGEFFAVTYSSLILFMFFAQIVVADIVDALFGSEVVIVYINAAQIFCVTLASILPNRARQILLESTEQSLAMKQSFVRYLSHEMRTPINVAFVGLTMHRQYLEERGQYTSECQEMLTDIKDAIGVALETLNEVLNYEKLQSKAMALEATKEEPLSFVLSSLGIFKATAANAGITLVLPSAAVASAQGLQHCFLEVDAHKMSQVLHNFMSNALKFTPSGGSIVVSLRSGDLRSLRTVSSSQLHSNGNDDFNDNRAKMRRRNSQDWVESLFFLSNQPEEEKDSWLEISVTDSGIGIAPENLPRVFNEIVQFNPNRNQGGNGSGLGLYISKGIVELHGGEVLVRSEGLNKGSTFSVLLPLSRKKLPAIQETRRSLSKLIRDSFLLCRIGKVSPTAGDIEMRLTEEIAAEDKRNLGAVAYSPVLENIGQADEGLQAGPSMIRDLEVQNFEAASFKDMQLRVSTNRLADPEVMSSKTCPATQQIIVPPREHAESLKGLKILLVDDSPINLKMCAKLFERMGAVVDRATDGLEAVKMIELRISASSTTNEQISAKVHSEISLEQSSNMLEEKSNKLTGGDSAEMYDVVVMDNLMPRMNGPTACREMRALGFKSPIIGLTGHALAEDVSDYIAHGANAVLTKPLNLMQFNEVLGQYRKF